MTLLVAHGSVDVRVSGDSGYSLGIRRGARSARQRGRVVSATTPNSYPQPARGAAAIANVGGGDTRL